MSKMLQIRNVPDNLHRSLKARAALAGMSMSDYALRIIRGALERPTRDELLARLAELPSPELDVPPADVIREERDRR
jgi:plasmid stability protein